MSSTLILSTTLFTKLNSLKYSLSEWQSIQINDAQGLHIRIIEILNDLNFKLKITKVLSGATGEKSSNYGFVINNNTNQKIAHVFIIPPGSDSRSGFLAQHVYPALKTITDSMLLSNCYELANLPVYVLNLNEFNLTDSKIINIRGILTIGFAYADIFNRPQLSKFDNIEELDVALTKVNGTNNQYFDLDSNTKSISFKTTTLNANTNDRYFFCAKAYPALYLASKQLYKIDITTFSGSSVTQNGTLETFQAYANKLTTI